MASVFAPGSPVRRWAPWAALVVVIVTALSVAGFSTRDDPTAQERVNSIARIVKCPVCSGESVAESNAPASQEIRLEIARQVQQGQSDEQILNYYSARYGQAILLTPPATGVSVLVWVVPVAALAVAIAGLVIVFRRWSQEPMAHASEADRVLVAESLRSAVGDSTEVDDTHGEGASR